ncbi:hypothetical protein [Kaistella yonginensis]|uniref:hypothetical protein n=1 Tax=Kaistella yonginensis TaxID=658267 RepID=UPI0025B46F4C|nr:hypothetical protein [Kaistella yonginensis]MDN3605677.1 hypothetical protein [Kaistella yonginensis]
MNILFAYDIKQNDNEFVRIHIGVLKNLGLNVVASKQEFWNPTVVYDMVIINWPDCFFSWRTDISNEEVNLLNTALLQFKKSGTQILTFFHDEYSHFGRGSNLNLLFDICYGNADILVHLGEYSKKKYERIYSNATHYIIHHPLYEEFIVNMDKQKSRKMLGIKEKDILVIVPGAIRNKDEIDYALKVFKSLNVPAKKLIFMRTSYLQNPSKINSMIAVKSLLHWLFFKHKYKYIDKIIFRSGYMLTEEVSHYFAAADLVIIPRVDILNSGNIILAAQFGKQIIGTGKGNMAELLNFLGQHIFAPEYIEGKHTVPFEKINTEVQKKIEQYSGLNAITNQWKKVLNL